MVQSQRLRGPDAIGEYECNAVSLGHNLLRVLPCSHSAQPFTTCDGSLAISYNGEIYNYRELRGELVAMGVIFRSDTDTETILELYRARGVEGFARLRGMFAFALYDRRSETTVVACDRSGQKPLYVRHVDGATYLASTIAALRVPSIAPVSVDEDQLRSYLWTLFPQEDGTLLSGIELVPPGTFRRYDTSGRIVDSGCFSAHSAVDEYDYDLESAAEELRFLLRQAVNEQLYGTNNVAGHLSGGLDSSAIMHAAVATGRQDLRSFSCSYGGESNGWMEDERGFEEAIYGKLVAQHLKLENRAVTVQPEDYASVLIDLVLTIDEPRGNPCLPQYLLARAVAEDHRVVLSGEGADEFFGGYPWKLQYAHESDPRRFLEALAPAPVEVLSKALDPNFSDPSIASTYVADRIDAPTSDVRVRNILRFDQDHFLRYLLLQADKLSGRFSLEGRYPFLDDRLIALSRRLPAKFLMGGIANSKPVLREALRNALPAKILSRPKVGFVAPEGTWYQGTLLSFIQKLLLDAQSFVQTLYGPGMIRELIDEHVDRRRNYRKLIWSLTTLEIWHRMVIQGQSRDELEDMCHHLVFRNSPAAVRVGSG